jgi:hypothetical protein
MKSRLALAILSLVASLDAAATTYQFRQYAKGVVAAPPPVIAAPAATLSGSGNFGSVHIGEEGLLDFVLTNTSQTAPLTISNIGLSGAGVARAGADTCPSSFPATLAAGASCTISATWSPSQVGTLTGATLTVGSNANNGAQNVSLSGTALAQPGDPYWANVTMLLPLTGAEGGKILTDLSSLQASPTSVGAAGQVNTTTSQSKWGGGSLLVTNWWGGGSWGMGYAQFPANSAYNFGTGDFTVELWTNWSGYSCGSAILGVYSDTASNWSLGHSQGKPVFTINNSTGTGSALTVASATPLPLNTWHHLAVSRQAGALRLFVNGQAVATGSATMTTEAYSAPLPMTVGNAVPGGNGCFSYTVYENDLRITKGVARYTGDFTPPQAAFKAN